MKFKKKYKDGVDDLVIDQKLNDAESERMMEVNTPKKSIIYKSGDFNNFSAEDKKKYREGIASGKAFSIGDREYAAANKKQQSFSAKMENSNKSIRSNSTEKNNNTSLASMKAPSLTSITAKQIATPNKQLQKEEQTKKDFNISLERARIKAANATKPGSMGDPNNPDVKAYLNLLKQRPLTNSEIRQINDTKDSVDPTNIALTAMTMLGVGGVLKYGPKYAKPLLNKIPVGKLLKGFKMPTQVKKVAGKLSQVEYDKQRAIEYTKLLNRRPKLDKWGQARVNFQMSNDLVPKNRGLLLDGPLSPDNLKKLAKSKAIQDMEKEGIEVASKLKFKKVK